HCLWGVDGRLSVRVLDRFGPYGPALAPGVTRPSPCRSRCSVHRREELYARSACLKGVRFSAFRAAKTLTRWGKPQMNALALPAAISLSRRRPEILVHEPAV